MQSSDAANPVVRKAARQAIADNSRSIDEEYLFLCMLDLVA